MGPLLPGTMAVVSPSLGKNACYGRLSTLSVSVLQLHDRTVKLHGLQSRFGSATSTGRSIWRPTDEAAARHSARRRSWIRLLGSLRFLAVPLSLDVRRSSGVRGKESDSSGLFSTAAALCIPQGPLPNRSAALTYCRIFPILLSRWGLPTACVTVRRFLVGTSDQ